MGLALGTQAAPSPIKQNASHRGRRYAQEMSAVLPIKLVHVHQPQISLVDQLSSLHSVARPFIAEGVGCNAAEFPVDTWQQLNKGFLIAACPVTQ